MDVKKEDVIVKEDPKEEAVKEVTENNTESDAALINIKRERLSNVVYVGPKVSGIYNNLIHSAEMFLKVLRSSQINIIR